MTKDYKPRQIAPRAKSGGGLLLGLFIGFLLGMGVAAAIAIYLFKTPVPFINRAKPPEKAASGLTDAAKQGKPEDAKPRFDFYRILPGQEETVTEQQIKQAAQAAAKAGAPSTDTYVLQAGAFQNPADADNLKAKLALLGLEASVEPTNLPDKGVWYRVRLGPYASVDEINRVRAQLAQESVEASVVKIKDPAKN
jgi:cell division protein FtsN